MLRILVPSSNDDVSTTSSTLTPITPPSSGRSLLDDCNDNKRNDNNNNKDDETCSLSSSYFLTEEEEDDEEESQSVATLQSATPVPVPGQVLPVVPDPQTTVTTDPQPSTLEYIRMRIASLGALRPSREERIMRTKEEQTELLHQTRLRIVLKNPTIFREFKDRVRESECFSNVGVRATLYRFLSEMKLAELLEDLRFELKEEVEVEEDEELSQVPKPPPSQQQQHQLKQQQQQQEEAPRRGFFSSPFGYGGSPKFAPPPIPRQSIAVKRSHNSRRFGGGSLPDIDDASVLTVDESLSLCTPFPEEEEEEEEEESEEGDDDDDEEDDDDEDNDDDDNDGGFGGDDCSCSSIGDRSMISTLSGRSHHHYKRDHNGNYGKPSSGSSLNSSRQSSLRSVIYEDEEAYE